MIVYILVIHRQTIHTWYTNAYLQKLETEKCRLADEHRATVLLRRLFPAWRHWAALHAHRKLQTALKVESAREALGKGERMLWDFLNY